MVDGVNAARPRDRRTEELDEVVAQLKNLGDLGPQGDAGRQRVAPGGGAAPVGGGREGEREARPLIVDDDDDDDDLGVAPDGTLLASTPARPL